MKYKIEDFTIEEKLKLIVGEEEKSLYIPGKLDGIVFRDGPCGIRNI